MFNNDLPSLTLRTISLSFIGSNSITSSLHFSATNLPTPEIPSSQPIQKNLQLPIVLAFPPFHLVSCKQQKSRRLVSIIFTISPLLPRIVPTFTLPTLNLTLLLIANLSLIPPGYLTASAHLVDPGDARSGMIFFLLWLMYLQQVFFLRPDALP